MVGFHRSYKLQAILALVPDVEHLAIGKIWVGNGHHHVAVISGLPLAATVVDGDVVGGQSLLAVCVIALHRGGLHRGVGRHRARHRKAHTGTVVVPQALAGHHRRRGRVMACRRARGVPSRFVVRRLGCPRGWLESRQHHEHKAQCQGEMFTHGLVRAVVLFYQAVYNLISHCRICHDVIILIYYFYYYYFFHFFTFVRHVPTLPHFRIPASVHTHFCAILHHCATSYNTSQSIATQHLAKHPRPQTLSAGIVLHISQI